MDKAVNISLTIAGAGVQTGYGSGQASPAELEGILDVTKCLLIDGDSAQRRRLEQLLSALGLDTALLAAPDDAVRYCNDNSPDVVMVSAETSGVQPRDIVKRLRRSAHGKPPVVFLYADTPDTGMIGLSILEGAADVLMTPFDRDILQFKLKQAGIIA